MTFFIFSSIIFIEQNGEEHCLTRYISSNTTHAAAQFCFIAVDLHADATNVSDITTPHCESRAH